ncbi:MAG: TolC family protein, partial [Thermodesulfobacteriota bacterium]
MCKLLGIIVIVCVIGVTETFAAEDSYTSGFWVTEGVKLLSLSDAVQISLENHPDAAIADQTLLKSRAALEGARSELFPRLDLVSNNRYTDTIEEFEPIQISFDFLGTAYTLSPTKDIPDYQSDVSLQVTERFFTGGHVLNTIKGAKSRVSAADSQKEIKRRDIILSTIKVYWELKRAEKIVEIEKERVGQSETILRVAKAKYEKGAISGLERAKAEVEVINNREALLQAETAR